MMELHERPVSVPPASSPSKGEFVMIMLILFLVGLDAVMGRALGEQLMWLSPDR